jgi:hypothetical protein
MMTPMEAARAAVAAAPTSHRSRDLLRRRRHRPLSLAPAARPERLLQAAAERQLHLSVHLDGHINRSDAAIEL